MTDVYESAVPEVMPASTQSSEMDQGSVDASHSKDVERLLSDKLVDGFTLLESSCPACATPLVRKAEQQRPNSPPVTAFNKITVSKSGEMSGPPMMVASKSFEQPFHPVSNVPYCVSCEAHVVISEEDLVYLSNEDTFKEKGSILVSPRWQVPSEQSDWDETVEVPTPDEVVEDSPVVETKAAPEPAAHEESPLVVETKAAAAAEKVPTSPCFVCGVGSSDLNQVDDEAVETMPAELKDKAAQLPFDEQDEIMVSHDAFVPVEEATKELVVEESVETEEEKPVEVEMPVEKVPEEPAEEKKLPTRIQSPLSDHGIEFSYTEHQQVEFEEEEEEPVEVQVEEPVEEEEVEEPVEEEPVEDETVEGPVEEPVEEEKKELAPEEIIQDYSVRREIATKVLGSKMLQGYSLREVQCEKCGMPLMERLGETECVVCPVLVKKAKKKLKEQQEAQRLVEQKAALEAEIERQAEAAAKAKVEEEAAALKKAQEEEEAAALKKAQEEEEAAALKAQEEEEAAALAEASQAAASAALEAEAESQAAEAATEAQEEEEEEAAALEAKGEQEASAVLNTQEEDAAVADAKEEAETATALKIVEEAEAAARAEKEAAVADVPSTADPIMVTRDATSPTNFAVATIGPSTADPIMATRDVTSPTNFAVATSGSGMEETHAQAEANDVATLLQREAQLVEEARLHEAARLERLAILEEEASQAEQARLDYEAKLVEEEKQAEEAMREETERLLEETRRLERLEEFYGVPPPPPPLVQSSSAVAAMREEQERAAAQARMEEEMLVAEELKAAEDARIEAELEAKRRADEQRAMSEAEYIQSLEEDANHKRLEAEEALRKAQEALEEVASARKHVIANTIAQGEQDAVAEAEALLSAEQEAFMEPPISPPSAEELEEQRWETLHAEGRATMTRRMLQGWSMMPELCKGIKCGNPPLISNGEKVECVVCGGSGSGLDGVYETLEVRKEDEVVEEDEEEAEIPAELADMVIRATLSSPVPEEAHQVETKSVEQVKEDFEAKREMVSKEIGKMMMEGWMLLDLSCPVCVMPLMSDGEGGPETCVLCGPMPNGELPKPTEPVVSEPMPNEELPKPTEPVVSEASVMDPPTAAADALRSDPPPTPASAEAKIDAPEEVAKADAPEADASLEEVTKADAPEADAALEEVAKADAPEADASLEEVTKADAPEADAAPEEVTKVDAPEADAAPEEVTKADAPEADAAPEEVTKADAPEAGAAPEEAFKEDSLEADDAVDPVESARAKSDPLSPHSVSSVSRPYLSVDPPAPSFDEQDIRFAASRDLYTEEGREVPIESVQRREDDNYDSPISVEQKEDDGDEVLTLKLPPGFDMDDEEALMALIAQSRKGKKSPKNKEVTIPSPVVVTEEIKEVAAPSPGTQVISTSPANDDISRMTDPTFANQKFFPGSVEQKKEETESPVVPTADAASTAQSSKRRLPPRPGMSPRAKMNVKQNRKTGKARRGPPRPDDPNFITPRMRGSGGSVASRGAQSLPPPSPRGVPSVVGGAPDDRSVVSAHSRADTVASEALGSILHKMEECKTSLAKGDVKDINSQLEMATLIEKLATAAVAVKQLEQMK